MTDWRELPEFLGISLEDTWILGWAYDKVTESLIFNVEFSLWPGHPIYEPPRPDQWTCYKPGRLQFSGVGSLTGLLAQGEVRPSFGADGVRDYGNFDGLEATSGEYRVVGDFGDTRFMAASMLIVIDS